MNAHEFIHRQLHLNRGLESEKFFKSPHTHADNIGKCSATPMHWGENIGGAPVVAKRITRPQDAVACRVLYIGASEAGQLDSIFAALGNSSVLTVADIPDFIKRGGMIQFVLDESRIRFEINLAVSRRSGMNLSSEMLKVARVVRRSL